MSRKHRKLDAEGCDRQLLRESALLILEMEHPSKDVTRSMLVLACQSLDDREAEALKKWLIKQFTKN